MSNFQGPYEPIWSIKTSWNIERNVEESWSFRPRTWHQRSYTGIKYIHTLPITGTLHGRQNLKLAKKIINFDIVLQEESGSDSLECLNDQYVCIKNCVRLSTLNQAIPWHIIQSIMRTFKRNFSCNPVYLEFQSSTCIHWH